MKKRSLAFIALILLVFAAAPSAFGQQAMTAADTDFLVRANLGFDVFDLGFAFGVGGGYRFPVGFNTTELLVDVYYSPPFKDEYVEGIWEYQDSSELLILAARFDWLFLYTPGKTGFFPIVGAGFFAGVLWWERIVTQVGLPSNTWTDSEDYFASGTVLNLGAGFAFRQRFEARFEIPVLVFFGDYGASAVAIPLTFSFLYKF